MQRNNSNMVIGVGVERNQASNIKDENEDEDDDEDHASDDNRELFSGLLGNGEEDAVAKKEKKRQEKK